MTFHHSPPIDSALHTLAALKMLSCHEQAKVRELCQPDGVFAHALDRAETFQEGDPLS
jgi:hypothetical protein